MSLWLLIGEGMKLMTRALWKILEREKNALLSRGVGVDTRTVINVVKEPDLFSFYWNVSPNEIGHSPKSFEDDTEWAQKQKHGSNGDAHAPFMSMYDVVQQSSPRHSNRHDIRVYLWRSSVSTDIAVPTVRGFQQRRWGAWARKQHIVQGTMWRKQHIVQGTMWTTCCPKVEKRERKKKEKWIQVAEVDCHIVNMMCSMIISKLVSKTNPICLYLSWNTSTTPCFLSFMIHEGKLTDIVLHSSSIQEVSLQIPSYDEDV